MPSSILPPETLANSHTPYYIASPHEGAGNADNKLTAAATKELNKAGAAIKRSTGGIELYSAKYYAACTLGGMLACVRLSALLPPHYPPGSSCALVH